MENYLIPRPDSVSVRLWPAGRRAALRGGCGTALREATTAETVTPRDTDGSTTFGTSWSFLLGMSNYTEKRLLTMSETLWSAGTLAVDSPSHTSGCFGGPSSARGRQAFYGTRPSAMAWQVVLGFAILTVAAADPGRFTEETHRGLELWASGQLTLREQLVQAETSQILGAPLLHSEGEMAPPTLATAAPGHDVDQDHVTEEDRRAVHVSIWISTPYFGSTVVDLGIGFPVTEGRLCDAVKSTTTETPDYAETIIPTVPQVGQCFGSCLAIPSWIPAVGKTALVMDNRRIGGEHFSFYHDGPLTMEALRRQLPEDDAYKVDLYLFGSLVPLGTGAEPDPVQGGIVQAVYEGEPCHWEDELTPELLCRRTIIMRMSSTRALRTSLCTRTSVARTSEGRRLPRS